LKQRSFFDDEGTNFCAVYPSHRLLVAILQDKPPTPKGEIIVMVDSISPTVLYLLLVFTENMHRLFKLSFDS